MYRCQQANPDIGDWCQLKDQDFEEINLHINENHSESMNVTDFKNIVKTSVRNAAFKKLQALKESHTKVEHNQYDNLNHPQGYLTSETITNQQCSILFALRSHSLRGIRENFKKMYLQNTLCPLCERFSDSQLHILQCLVLKDIRPMVENVEYNHIYGTTQQQEQLVKVYEIYLGIRDELLDDPSQQSLPGLYTGPQQRQARTERNQYQLWQ